MPVANKIHGQRLLLRFDFFGADVRLLVDRRLANFSCIFAQIYAGQATMMQFVQLFTCTSRMEKLYTTKKRLPLRKRSLENYKQVEWLTCAYFLKFGATIRSFVPCPHE
jgi:hypothetical protein